MLALLDNMDRLLTCVCIQGSTHDYVFHTAESMVGGRNKGRTKWESGFG